MRARFGPPCFTIGRRAIAELLLLCLAATSAQADLVRYTWSGFVEAVPGSGNPWALQGDGLSVTPTDGTPFSLVGLVETDAIDLDGSLNPSFARFTAVGATLTIGGHFAKLTTPQLQFANDSFDGLFDSARFQATAELFGPPLFFAADVRLAATTFSLASPAAPDAPPRFPNTVPIQFGGSVSTALVTFAQNAPVSAQLETCPGPESVLWSSPGTGVADGIAVTVTNLGGSGLDTFSLRGANFAAAEQCSSARSLTHATGSDWSVTLAPPTNALLLYAKFWRGSGAGVSPVTYQFSAPFTVLSGLTGATVSNGNTRLALPASSFHDGILRFNGPIASLSVDVDTLAAAEQATTFAVLPEPGLAVGLGIGCGVLLARAARRAGHRA